LQQALGWEIAGPKFGEDGWRRDEGRRKFYSCSLEDAQLPGVSTAPWGMRDVKNLPVTSRLAQEFLL
jgi:hypothetical protein